MTFSLSTFRQNVSKPARPTLFQVIMPNVLGGSDMRFVCQASTVPGVTVGNYQIKYQGREIQYAGDLTFDTWKVTVINQEGNTIRKRFETWFQTINAFDTGRRGQLYTTNGAVENTNSYKQYAEIEQFDHSGEVKARYKVSGMFPTILDPLTLDWTQTDQYQTFDVTFAFDWWQTLSVDTPSVTVSLAPTTA
jgi:hypothetical protein